ncbi:hypothetical protein IQ241_17980 [Romeria aff. gracilis LEGE 07310]|uniref:Uncharacterized protein n=1 Tax=Vasconcelosia minhoensis LEGE 07310 TaxID=915328 RepID=A0A8J7AAH3_9CYAN|nr:hypothetical protein [Romeria gracilis]MBE9079165.1 hypothetical protein [Romeria aff. gracilis LEGE 07310]
MLTIQTKATVGPSNTLRIQLPEALPAGEYSIVLVIDDAQRVAPPRTDLRDFPVDDYGELLSEVSLRREDTYDD